MLENLQKLEIDLFLGFVEILNSGFGAAMAGAFFGAMAANYFARRSETKKLFVDQQHATNAATRFSIAIFQHSLGIKSQIISPIVGKFHEDKERYENFLKSSLKGETKGIFSYQKNFGTIQLFRHSADKLEDLILLQTGADKKVPMAATFLQQTPHSLDVAISGRAEVLDGLVKLQDEISDDQFAYSYFGIQTVSGSIDARLSNVIESMQVQLDDTIFYSKYLADNLSILSIELSKKVGKNFSNPVSFTFDQETYGHLLPDGANYPDWID